MFLKDYCWSIAVDVLRRWSAARFPLGRPETMCPPANFPGPLVPKMNRSGNTTSLHWYISVIMHQPKCIVLCIITEIYQCRNIVFLRWFIRGRGVPEILYWDMLFQDVQSPHPSVWGSPLIANLIQKSAKRYFGNFKVRMAVPNLIAVK